MSNLVDFQAGGSLKERVAEEVRVLMTRRRARQSDLAKVLHVSQAQVSQRLNGHVEFTVPELDALADYFAVLALPMSPPCRRTIGVDNTPTGSPTATAGDNVRAEMARRRLSQQALGGLIDMSQASLSLRLNGHTSFSIDELVNIAVALDVPLDRLTEGVAA